MKEIMFDGLKYVLENIKVENLVISKQKEEYENYKDIYDRPNAEK